MAEEVRDGIAGFHFNSMRCLSVMKIVTKKCSEYKLLLEKRNEKDRCTAKI